MNVPVMRVLIRATRQAVTINVADFDPRLHVDPDAPKHPGGRPVLPPERRRAVRRKTYITPAEDAELQAIARMTGAKVSELVHAGIQRILATYRPALREFRGPNNYGAE